MTRQILTPEEIKDNWDTLMNIISVEFPTRSEALLRMYKDMENDMVLAPASIKAQYHNCFPGGYVDHILRVLRIALDIATVWSNNGSEDNFTREELIFTALHHDLGKIGDGSTYNYIEQTDKWRVDNLGEFYINNPDLGFMLIQDRSLYILQKYNIPLTYNEYITIRIHDGLYDEANKAYFFSYNPDSKLKSDLPLILHQADLCASTIEFRTHYNTLKPKKKGKSVYTKKPTTKQIKPSGKFLNMLDDTTTDML